MNTFLNTSQQMAEAVCRSYQNGEDDYNMKPIVLVDSLRKPIGTIQDGDSVIFCCKRGEREIQLTDCFVEPEFNYFERKRFDNLFFAIFTLYHYKYLDLNVPVVFQPSPIHETLGYVIAQNHLSQLHIAESEKFAHVTFFFNGGMNIRYQDEEDIKIPSPKGIPFEKIPQLSLPQITDALVVAIKKGIYNFIVANFANGDVIGHTSNFQAKISCAREVDRHLKQVVEVALENDYTVIITADHGILETGFKENGKPNVSHTTVPVPFILVDPKQKKLKLNLGRLANIASTILKIMGLKIPKGFEVSLFAEEPIHTNKKLLLIILDGWGIGKEDQGNPICVAQTPFLISLMKNYSSTTLRASGEDVGLLAGKPGNSEAGHINIGAGRVVIQDDVIIQKSIEDDSFNRNPVLVEAMKRLRKAKGNLHLIGLLSEKSSHGNRQYILKTVEMAKNHGFDKVFIHLILDGRSTEPGSAPEMILNFGDSLRSLGLGTICTVMGRGIALDRSQDYVGKTKLAYDALVYGIGKHVAYHGKV